MAAHASDNRTRLSIFRSLIHNRAILWQLMRRNIEFQIKGSFLGVVWLVLNPLLMLALYSVVFGVIMKGSFNVTENPNPFEFPLGIFIGLAIIGIMTETLGVSPNAVISQANLVKKVVFPVEVLPIANIGPALNKFCVSILLFFLGVILFGPDLRLQALLFPLVMLPILIMALGVAYLVSGLGVYFRDSQQMMNFIGVAIFYSSAVFYPADRVRELPVQWLQEVLLANPMLRAIELSRDLLLWNRDMTPEMWGWLGSLYLWGFGTLLFGYWAFNRLRDGFADVI